MSDAHDLQVLQGLIAAIRATPGAPEASAAELEAEASRHAPQGSPAPSLIDAAREALGGIVGQSTAAPAEHDAESEVGRLAALMARLEAAMRDERLSGPARDAVIRAFDPVKAARDAALQKSGD